MGTLRYHGGINRPGLSTEGTLRAQPCLTEEKRNRDAPSSDDHTFEKPKGPEIKCNGVKASIVTGVQASKVTSQRAESQLQKSSFNI